MWSWGWNDRGTLGHGHRAVERKPRRVQVLKGVRIVQVRPAERPAISLSHTALGGGGTPRARRAGLCALANV